VKFNFTLRRELVNLYIDNVHVNLPHDLMIELVQWYEYSPTVKEVAALIPVSTNICVHEDVCLYWVWMFSIFFFSFLSLSH
jgi:hypothetical protein